MSDVVEIRLDDKDRIDEVLASGADIHIERMDRGVFWFRIGECHFWMRSKGKISLEEGA